MFIWEFKILVKWNYHDENDAPDEEDYTVSGENFDKAYEKVRKLALRKSRKFKDEDGTFYPMSIEDVKNVTRGSWIDG